MKIRPCMSIAMLALAAVDATPASAQDSLGSSPQQSPPAQNYPQQSGGPAQPQGPSMGGGANLDQLMKEERRDYGVKPINQLYSGTMHSPTPASIPGGQVITTKGLVALLDGKQIQYLLFDVLGGSETLPGAIPSAWVSQPGSFDDQIQQQFSQALGQSTQGNNQVPLIFYCLSTECWMSYNGALRAIHAGYKNVLWYRGGLEAWKMAGLPTRPAPQR